MKCLSCNAEMVNFFIQTLTDKISYDICEECGSFWLDKGELDKAKIEFERSLVLIPEAPTMYYYLAVIHHRQGNLVLAEENLKKELVNYPANEQAKKFLQSLKIAR